MMKKQSGLTLIEIVVVVGLGIAVLIGSVAVMNRVFNGEWSLETYRVEVTVEQTQGGAVSEDLGLPATTIDRVEQENDDITTVQEDEVNAPVDDVGGIDTSSWQTYRNKELGFEFSYPNEWGDVVEQSIFGTSEYFYATFSKLGWIDEETGERVLGSVFFGAPSVDYVTPGRGGSVTDFQGYVVRDGNYYEVTYIVEPGMEPTGPQISESPSFDFTVIQAVNTEGILVRNEPSWADAHTDVRFNLNNEKWPGITFAIKTGISDLIDPFGGPPIIQADDSKFIEVFKTFKDLNLP